jgi:DNA polymerase-3 subunit delta'
MTDGPLEPRANPELIGQDGAEAEFLQAWQSGRLAHAWLITGPRGIGKATLACRIARFALSGGPAPAGLFGEVEPPSLQMSADHPVFKRVASGGHADFKLIERGWADDKQSKRKNEITIDDVRDIGGFMALTPAEGGWRVVVVDAADEMNRNSANAILKILEAGVWRWRRCPIRPCCHCCSVTCPNLRRTRRGLWPDWREDRSAVPWRCTSRAACRSMAR